MKEVVNATVTVLLVSLLSGCSSSSEPVDIPQAKTECELVREKGSELLTIAGKDAKTKSRELAAPSSLLWAYYTIEKAECFDAQMVAQAKTIIALWQRK